MAMLDTVLDFGGSPSANIGPSWWGDPFHPVKRVPGQLLGLGAVSIPEDIMAEARACSAGDSTACSTYYAWYAKNVQTGGGSCPPMPGEPSTGIMSSPACAPSDGACISLSSQIEQYNLALIRAATQEYNHAVCEHNKCLNGDGTDCNSRFPPVGIPSPPNYPDARTLQWTNGFVTGYGSGTTGAGGAGGSSGSGSGMTDSQEVAGAKQSLVNAMASLGVGGSQALMAKLDSEFTKGLSWWLASHGNYSGLSSYTSTRAVETVRQWIRDLGITTPPPVKSADGTAKVPAAGGSGQGGNTSTPPPTPPAAPDKVASNSTTGGVVDGTGAFSLSKLPLPTLLLAGAAVFMLMSAGGRR